MEPIHWILEILWDSANPVSYQIVSNAVCFSGETASLFPEMSQNVSKEIEDEANSYFQRIYNHPPHPTLSIDEVLEMLSKFKESTSKRERVRGHLFLMLEFCLSQLVISWFLIWSILMPNTDSCKIDSWFWYWFQTPLGRLQTSELCTREKPIGHFSTILRIFLWAICWNKNLS